MLFGSSGRSRGISAFRTIAGIGFQGSGLHFFRTWIGSLARGTRAWASWAHWALWPAGRWSILRSAGTGTRLGSSGARTLRRPASLRARTLRSARLRWTAGTIIVVIHMYHRKRQLPAHPLLSKFMPRRVQTLSRLDSFHFNIFILRPAPLNRRHNNGGYQGCHA